MKKTILVALATLTMVSTMNAENRFHKYGSASTAESDEVPTVVGTLGGMAVGSLISPTLGGVIGGAIVGGLAINAAQPKSRAKMIKVTKTLLNKRD